MQNNSQPDNFGHAARALHFDQTLSLIATRCVNEYARRELDALSPSTNRDSIRRSLKTIEQYRVLHDQRGDVAVPEVDYRDAVERLVERGDSLEAADLLRIKSGERTAADVHKHLNTAPDEFPLLCEMAGGLTPHPELVTKIERSIEPDGGVKDNASPELASIRRQIGRSRGSLRGRSEKLTAGYGQESFPTMLGTRYVILVPRTQFHKRDGMVHSTSHKGGSVYFEPFDLVEKNNELETLIIDEGVEVARILRELSDGVRDVAGDLLANVDVMIEADMLRARASMTSSKRFRWCWRLRAASIKPS